MRSIVSSTEEAKERLIGAVVDVTNRMSKLHERVTVLNQEVEVLRSERASLRYELEQKMEQLQEMTDDKKAE